MANASAYDLTRRRAEHTPTSLVLWLLHHKSCRLRCSTPSPALSLKESSAFAKERLALIALCRGTTCAPPSEGPLRHHSKLRAQLSALPTAAHAGCQLCCAVPTKCSQVASTNFKHQLQAPTAHLDGVLGHDDVIALRVAHGELLLLVLDLRTHAGTHAGEGMARHHTQSHQPSTPSHQETHTHAEPRGNICSGPGSSLCRCMRTRTQAFGTLAAPKARAPRACAQYTCLHRQCSCPASMQGPVAKVATSVQAKGQTVAKVATSVQVKGQTVAALGMRPREVLKRLIGIN